MYVTAVGSNLQAETATGENNQLWRFKRNSDGTYLITSAADSRAIDVSGGGGHYNSGNNIGLWTATGDHPQKWSLMIDEQGYFHFKSHGGKTVFDLYNNDNIPGTNIHLWEEHDGDAQRFLLKFSSLNLGEEFDATLKLETVDFYVQSQNSVVGIGNPTDGAEQTWHFTRNGDGTYNIQNAADGKMLDVANGVGTVNGTAIITGNRSNTKNQRWTIHSSTNGSYTIQTICGGRVLDVPNANFTNGTALQIHDRNNTDAQRIVITLTSNFVLKDGVTDVLNDKYLKIYNKAVTAKNTADKFKCEIAVLNLNGFLVADGAYIGTGYTVVRYGNSGQVLNSVTVIIPGDLSGDGNISTTDMAAVRKLLNTSVISDIAKEAADVTGDSIVSTADFLALRKHCNGANSIY